MDGFPIDNVKPKGKGFFLSMFRESGNGVKLTELHGFRVPTRESNSLECLVILIVIDILKKLEHRR